MHAFAWCTCPGLDSGAGADAAEALQEGAQAVACGLKVLGRRHRLALGSPLHCVHIHGGLNYTVLNNLLRFVKVLSAPLKSGVCSGSILRNWVISQLAPKIESINDLHDVNRTDWHELHSIKYLHKLDHNSFGIVDFDFEAYSELTQEPDA